MKQNKKILFKKCEFGGFLRMSCSEKGVSYSLRQSEAGKRMKVIIDGDTKQQSDREKPASNIESDQIFPQIISFLIFANFL